MSQWQERLKRRLELWQARGLTRSLRTTACTAFDAASVQSGTNSLLNFASNDYLGLSQHPAIVDAGRATLLREGSGATASRLITGTRSVHVELESALANFKGTPAALIGPSGYQLAIATLNALTADAGAEQHYCILLDRLAHASLLDAARLTGVRYRTFKHNDVEELRRLLERESRMHPNSAFIVVIESLYSMDGDWAPLQALYDAIIKFDALLMVDEAHATGVLGANGSGLLAALAARTGKLPVDILAFGTLSKALASQGGFICGSEESIETIVNTGRAFIFSTGLSPVCAGMALEALRIVQAEPERRTHVLALGERLRQQLLHSGWQAIGGPGPLVPVVIGDEIKTLECAQALAETGFWVPAIRFPTVKRGQARLRISLNAALSEAQVQSLYLRMEELRDRYAF